MTVYFQGNGPEDWPTRVGSVGPDTTSGRINTANTRGGTSVQGAAASHYVESTPFSLTEFWIHGSEWDNTTGNNNAVSLAIYSGSTAYLAMKLSNADLQNKLAYWNGSAWVDSANYLSKAYGTRYVFDIYVKVGSPGEFRLYINGLPCSSFTGLDTTFGGAVSAFDKIRCFSPSTTQQGVWSEIIVADWNTIGSKLVGLYPNAAGNYNELTGAGYTAVDEFSPGGDLMSGASSGLRFSAGFTDPPSLGAGESIEALKISAWASADAGGPQSLNFFPRISGVDYHQSDVSLATNLGHAHTLLQVSPATSAAWTVAEITNAEFGIRVRP